MAATSVYAMPVSHDGLAPVSSNAVARQMTNATAARASHLTCCRSSRPPARYRTASDTNATARNATNTADTPLIVPIRTTRSTGGSRSAPSGLRKVTETPPGAGSCTSRGRTTRPMMLSPVSRNPAAATGRQRRDGSFPVGKSKTMNARMNPTPAKLTSAAVPACFAAGSAPGKVATPSTA